MMTEKDIEKMLEEQGELDMSHLNKDDILAKAKQEIYFGANATGPKKEKSSFPLIFTKKRFIPIIAGAALAITICVGSIGLYNENFQTVYIDINPSVALKLNRFDRVIGVEYLNTDAQSLLSNTKLVGCDAEEALTTVITACDNAGYVKDDSQIYLSAASKEEEKSEKLLKKLKGHAENMRHEKNENYEVNTYNAKKGENKDFEKESLSPAKYNAIKEIIDENKEYKLEDLKGKTMDDLHKIKHGMGDKFDKDDFDEDDFDEDDFDDDDRDGKEYEGKKPSAEKPEKDDEKNDKDNGRNNGEDKREPDDDDDRKKPR